MGEITTSLSERTRLVKMFKDYCKAKRIDFMPSTLLGWCDAQGYLNADKIREDLEKEKETLNNLEGNKNDDI